MKIALCLSGQPRYLDFGFLKIKNLILDKFNPDVFVHTWWDDSLVDKPFDLSKKLSYNRTCKWEKNTLTNIEEFYSPKYLNYESQRNFDIFEDVDYGLLNPISPYSMYYSIKMSNNLKIKYEKENNFRYDVVIRCRFDIDLISFNCFYKKKVLNDYL